uniref:Ribosomal protein S8 n=1 Tax=Aurantiochytrium acetophilum TaxID=2172886 RepID=A0A481XIV4_9STRA|nr:ribosomal protein S8 [Aurantiochytrium acetophilum]
MINFQRLISSLNIGIQQNASVVQVPNSKQNLQFISLLYKEGFIKAFQFSGRNIKVFLFKNNSLLKGKKFILFSHNKKDVYVSTKNLWAHSGLCSLFISTSKGSLVHYSKSFSNVKGGKLLAATI